ncbi:urotensin 1 [Brachionichthys hirsutus]|uniref:urotensin 1 n=1 Tax=Brachionichthys hirsutus TaxID=412623 RepID=UPI0036046F1C
MKPAPLLLLLSSVLSPHLRPSAGRALIFPSWLDVDGGGGRLQTQRLDHVFGRMSASELLSDDILRFLLRKDPEALRPLPAQEEDGGDAEVLKRSEEPQLSIDLTFHLLRSMIQMAKVESQRAQAQLNRKVLDEVGK